MLRQRWPHKAQISANTPFKYLQNAGPDVTNKVLPDGAGAGIRELHKESQVVKESLQGMSQYQLRNFCNEIVVETESWICKHLMLLLPR